MNLTTRTTQRLATTLSVFAAVAAMAAPVAQSKTPPSKLGELDPWAYNVIHQVDQTIPEVRTEHSDGQSRFAETKLAVTSGRFDPWMRNLLARTAQPLPLHTEHSKGENAVVYREAIPSISATTPLAPGFDWADAGVGAGTAIGLVMLAGAATMAVRRRYAFE